VQGRLTSLPVLISAYRLTYFFKPKPAADKPALRLAFFTGYWPLSAVQSWPREFKPAAHKTLIHFGCHLSP
jgi:hypothetical protein